MWVWRVLAVALAMSATAVAAVLVIGMARWARMPRRDAMPWWELLICPVPALVFGGYGIVALGRPANMTAGQAAWIYLIPILWAACGVMSLYIHILQVDAYAAARRLLFFVRDKAHPNGTPTPEFFFFEIYLENMPSVNSDEPWFSRGDLNRLLAKLPEHGFSERDRRRLRRLVDRHEASAARFDSWRH